MNNWRIALRSLCRRPGYSLAVILILVMGIGATTGLFSIVNSILLRPLPYPDSDRLVTLLEANPSGRPAVIAAPRLEDWNRLNRTFESIAGMYPENVTDSSGTEPERLAGWRVSPRFFNVYGTPPAVGRTFSRDEETYGGPDAAVISDGLWTRRFDRSPSALGRRLVLGGRGYTIVGVMPTSFAPAGIDVWLPAQFSPSFLRPRENRLLGGVGRMKSGVTREQAREDLARVERELGQSYPETDKGWSAIVGDLKEYRVRGYRQTLLLMFGAVALLLLIAVANVSGLTVAQLQRRGSELAIRSSLGASRGQLVGAVMREVLLLAAAGAAAGGALAALLVRAVSATFVDLPRLAELRLDWRALAFAAIASLVAAMVFGALPSIQATRSNLASALMGSTRSVTGGRSRWQQGLVVAQLAVAVLLLSGAGLLLRSYVNLTRVDTGFSARNVITFHVGAAWDEDRTHLGRIQQEIVGELQRLPGVETAGFVSFLPSTGAAGSFPLEIEGIRRRPEDGPAAAGERTVTSAYLQALKVPLLAGEWCPALEPFRLNAANRTLVNRRFVDMYAKNQNVIGRHLKALQSSLPNAPMNVIVGVVGDVREDGVAVPPAPYVYTCTTAGSYPDPEYVVRARADARALMGQVRQMVQQIDPHRAVFGMKTLDSVFTDVLERPRLNARFLGLFAAAAMLLAAVGLYGLIALMVAARTREIGVRMALGADAGKIAAMVFAGAGKLLVLGAGLGFCMTLATERLLKSALFGISALDTATLAGAMLLMAAVSAAASFLPARRAATVDPLRAIRMD
jgi:putative ABC transport system permease protein